MSIEVDYERCIGSGSCSLIAPEVFDQNDEDGRVVLLTDRPNPETAEAARQAVYACPSRALLLHQPHHSSQ